MRSKTILLGRVRYGPCDQLDVPGLADVRIVLEDGTNVLTDEDGNWHVEGLTPGTHIVQLDLESLDERYQLVDCEQLNNRFAGRSYSQFVDIQAGGLWRADFRVIDAPPPSKEVQIEQIATLREGVHHIDLHIKETGDAQLETLNAFYRMPRGWKMVPGSAEVDGQPAGPEKTIVGLRWPLNVGVPHTVSFDLIAPVIAQPKMKEVGYLESLPVDLADGIDDTERQSLNKLVKKLADSNIRSVVVKGHLFEGSASTASTELAKVADHIEMGVARPFPIVTSLTGENPLYEGTASRNRVELMYSLFEPAPPRQVIQSSIDFTFETRSAELDEEGLGKIKELIKAYSSYQLHGIQVVGHSDNIRIAPANRKFFKDNVALSQARAETVASQLQAAFKLPIEKVNALGMGDQFPIEPNNTAEGRRHNRRVDVLVDYSDPVVIAAHKSSGSPTNKKPAFSSALARFTSIGSPKGKTGNTKVNLHEVAGIETRSAVANGVALGSWDAQESTQSIALERDTREGIISHSDGFVSAQSVISVRVRLASSLLPRLFLEGGGSLKR